MTGRIWYVVELATGHVFKFEDSEGPCTSAESMKKRWRDRGARVVAVVRPK